MSEVLVQKNPLGDLVSCTGQGTLVHYSHVLAQTDAKAVVLVVHGMCEHQKRYFHFAEFLAQKGYLVYTLDLPGHGETGRDNLGFFADKDGDRFVPQDIDQLVQKIKESVDLPMHLFGHSMGSILVRYYLANFTSQLNSVILCGTVGKNPATGIGIVLARLSVWLFGSRHRALFINRLTQANMREKKTKAKEQKNDLAANAEEWCFQWLSRQEQVVENYVKDPLCGFMFTNSAFWALFKWIKSITTLNWAKQVKQRHPNLPIYLIAGDADPVGNYGRGVVQTKENLTKAGLEVELKLYAGAKHELINEINREEVYQDVANWLKRRS